MGSNLKAIQSLIKHTKVEGISNDRQFIKTLSGPSAASFNCVRTFLPRISQIFHLFMPDNNYTEFQSRRQNQDRNDKGTWIPFCRKVEELFQRQTMFRKTDLLGSYLSGDDGYFWYSRFGKCKQQFGSMSDDASVLLSRTCSEASEHVQEKPLKTHSDKNGVFQRIFLNFWVKNSSLKKRASVFEGGRGCSMPTVPTYIWWTSAALSKLSKQKHTFFF